MMMIMTMMRKNIIMQAHKYSHSKKTKKIGQAKKAASYKHRKSKACRIAGESWDDDSNLLQLLDLLLGLKGFQLSIVIVI